MTAFYSLGVGTIQLPLSRHPLGYQHVSFGGWLLNKGVIPNSFLHLHCISGLLLLAAL